MAVHSYDISLLTIQFNGLTITGLSDDGELTIARNEDSTTTKTGLQGDVVYQKNSDKSGKVEFGIFQTSSHLKKLQGWADKGTKGLLVVRYAGTDGNMLLSCKDCVITRVPDYAVGKDAKGAKVSIFVPQCVIK